SAEQRQRSGLERLATCRAAARAARTSQQSDHVPLLRDSSTQQSAFAPVNFRTFVPTHREPPQPTPIDASSSFAVLCNSPKYKHRNELRTVRALWLAAIVLLSPRREEASILGGVLDIESLQCVEKLAWMGRIWGKAARFKLIDQNVLVLC